MYTLTCIARVASGRFALATRGGWKRLLFGSQRFTAVVGAGYSWRLEATTPEHVSVGTSRDIFELFMSLFRPAEPSRGRISLPQIRHSPEICVFSAQSTLFDLPEASMSRFHVPTSPRDGDDDEDWRHPRPE